MSSARVWGVVLHMHSQNAASVRVHVDARPLLPACDGLPVEHALAYAEAALVDFQSGDQLALRAHGIAGSSIRLLRATDKDVALRWLRERAVDQHPSPAPCAEAVSDRGALSGTRAVVPDQREELAGCSLPKKSAL